MTSKFVRGLLTVAGGCVTANARLVLKQPTDDELFKGAFSCSEAKSNDAVFAETVPGAAAILEDMLASDFAGNLRLLDELFPILVRFLDRLMSAIHGASRDLIGTADLTGTGANQSNELPAQVLRNIFNGNGISQADSTDVISTVASTVLGFLGSKGLALARLRNLVNRMWAAADVQATAAEIQNVIDAHFAESPSLCGASVSHDEKADVSGTWWYLDPWSGREDGPSDARREENRNGKKPFHHIRNKQNKLFAKLLLVDFPKVLLRTAGGDHAKVDPVARLVAAFRTYMKPHWEGFRGRFDTLTNADGSETCPEEYWWSHTAGEPETRWGFVAPKRAEDLLQNSMKHMTAALRNEPWQGNVAPTLQKVVRSFLLDSETRGPGAKSHLVHDVMEACGETNIFCGGTLDWKGPLRKGSSCTAETKSVLRDVLAGFLANDKDVEGDSRFRSVTLEEIRGSAAWQRLDFQQATPLGLRELAENYAARYKNGESAAEVPSLALLVAHRFQLRIVTLADAFASDRRWSDVLPSLRMPAGQEVVSEIYQIARNALEAQQSWIWMPPSEESGDIGGNSISDSENIAGTAQEKHFDSSLHDCLPRMFDYRRVHRHPSDALGVDGIPKSSEVLEQILRSEGSADEVSEHLLQEWHPLCGGGAPENKKLAEDSARTLHSWRRELFKWLIADVDQKHPEGLKRYNSRMQIVRLIQLYHARQPTRKWDKSRMVTLPCFSGKSLLPVADYADRILRPLLDDPNPFSSGMIGFFQWYESIRVPTIWPDDISEDQSQRSNPFTLRLLEERARSSGGKFLRLPKRAYAYAGPPFDKDFSSSDWRVEEEAVEITLPAFEELRERAQRWAASYDGWPNWQAAEMRRRMERAERDSRSAEERDSRSAGTEAAGDILHPKKQHSPEGRSRSEADVQEPIEGRNGERWKFLEEIVMGVGSSLEQAS
jgi:hypothetical protein